MDPWILDINTWIIKAESHQHALGFREIPTLVLNKFWDKHAVRHVLPNHLLIDVSDPQGYIYMSNVRLIFATHNPWSF